MSFDKRPSIAVVGSINIDLVARCERLPQAGETVMSHGFAEIAGGKGANQAVAAARAGAKTAMIARVGSDGYADRLLHQLAGEGIDCAAVQRTAKTSTGRAMIAVADSGENQIVVIPGANGEMSPRDIDRFSNRIAKAEVLLLQLEVPLGVVTQAIAIAKRAGVRVVLDPAPAPATGFTKVLFDVDLICPNATEAASLVGRSLQTLDDLEAAAAELHARGAHAVAITLGERGTLLFDGDRYTLCNPFPVTAVDTTAAGDAFAGALAARWAEGADLVDAVRWGNAAGALASSHHGAQPAIPRREEIDQQANATG